RGALGPARLRGRRRARAARGRPRLLRPRAALGGLPGDRAPVGRTRRRRVGGAAVSARTVVLWRHGRTEYNATARLQGQVDIPLDEVGRWQAEQAARDLAERHGPTRIVSS